MGLIEVYTDQSRLICLVQNGQTHFYPELWETIRRFVYKQARRYYLAFKDANPLIELDELIHAGYIAMIAASESFMPNRGKTFASWLMYYLRREWRTLYGFDSKDALNHALSLDAPVSDTDGDLTLADSICDITEPTPEEAVEEAESRAWLKGAVDEFVSKLPDDYEDIVRASYLLGKTASALSEETGLDKKTIYRAQNKGLNKLRAMTRHTPLGRKIREYYKDSVRVHRVGLTEFSRTHTSEQEKYLLALERAEKKALAIMPYDGLEPEEVIVLADFRNKHYQGVYRYINKH